MGKLGMLVARKALREDAGMGKRLNVEVKKLIKANKEKQLAINFVDLEILVPAKADGKSYAVSVYRRLSFVQNGAHTDKRHKTIRPDCDWNPPG